MTTPSELTTKVDEVDVDEQNVPTGQIRRGMVVGDAGGKSREQRIYEKTIGLIEPDLMGRPEKLEQYVALYRSKFTGDKRLFHFDVTAEHDAASGVVTLTGTAEYAEHVEGVAKMLGYMGFERVENRIKLLPDPSLDGMLYGVVGAQQAFIYSATSEPRETITQTVFGDTVYILAATAEATYLVHSPDGYTGYIAQSDVLARDAAGIADWRGRDQAVLTRELEVDGRVLRLGVSLPVEHESAETATVLLPDGGTASLPADAVAIHRDEADPRSEGAIAAAMELRGIPYVWGGIASDGVDCSGMVQITHRSQGVLLPRDADMQGSVGALTGTRWHRDLIRRGDLMLFLGSRGTINHVGIYLGEGQYIESASGGVKITSLREGDENYSAKRDASFCFAKRLFK
ncbi:C40 family peptidase [Mucisphaera calidilacus]|nr:C40 family peptidase [Mucisphaera calidilacus]